MIDIIYLPWIFVVGYLHTLCVSYTQGRAEKYLKFPYSPLPDILQEKLPTINIRTPDKLLFISVLYTVGNVVWNQKYRIVNDEIVSLLCIFSIRPLFCCLTILPSCIPKPKKVSFYDDLFLSTHDLMFSGHTCFFIFMSKIINEPIGYIIGYILPISLIMSKVHYSIDVFVSMFVYNYIDLLLKIESHNDCGRIL